MVAPRRLALDDDESTANITDRSYSVIVEPRSYTCVFPSDRRTALIVGSTYTAVITPQSYEAE